MNEDTGPVGALTHLGIDVADLERAEAFYSALLGVKRGGAWVNTWLSSLCPTAW